MFEYIYEWLWNFICYVILMTALIQVLPENSYQKYLKFFFGMLMILLLSTPAFRLLGMEEHFHELYYNAEYRRVVNEMEQASEYIKQTEQEFWKEDIE